MLIHAKTIRRQCNANDLFISSGNILECGNCGCRDNDENNNNIRK